jgi:hypothetical protein
MVGTDDSGNDEQVDDSVVQPEVVEQNMNYFVTSNKLNVRIYPKTTATIRQTLRKGKALTALEIKGDWVRISDYEVHDSGEDIASWVHMDYLSHEKPLITEKEIRKSTGRLVNKSDDFLQYQDQFIIATRTLLDDERCSYEDFELMDGWVLSRTFNIEPVYFVYCGGTQTENKVYLNIETGELFRP